MGQTLTNGIFLPNEGERNCYTGLEGNWRAIDGYIGSYNVHIADAVIHVSQADRDKWDAVTGKADASALTAHTGNTTIHVTAADKTKWDAVTTKANDADVVHKAGAETIAGPKTFSDTVTVPSINGINPGLLSMPDLTAGVDISGYITTGNTDNNYTPSVDGWIWIRLIGNGASITQGDFGINANYVTDNLTQQKWVETNLFVSKNVQVTIRCRSITGILSAKFYPCQGNV